jgi:VWFA-related protein
MRALALLLALAGLVIPAFGAKRVTVEELERTLASAQNLPDADAAQRLSDLELTERLSRARFDRLDSKLPGEKSRQALMILADASSFLDPPSAEIPNQPTPDVATQRKIMALTVQYISQTVHQLPNLFATRVTTSFEDKPAAFTAYGGASSTRYEPIHLVGHSTVTVTFRDGREVVEKSKLDPRAKTLNTSGVFGPILGTILVDSARSKLSWSHWEQGQGGLLAVFSFAVPKEKSHYTITYDSVPNEPNPGSIAPQTFSELVAYHGEMVIDAASGTILRLMLQADMKPDEFTVKSGIEVEYGQVSIGGKSYFLPVRSVSSTLGHSLQVVEGDVPQLEVGKWLKTSLNDVVFENYHVFRSDAKILTDSEAAKLESQPVPSPSVDGSAQPDVANPSTPAATASALPPDSPQAAPPAGTSANPSMAPAAANAPPSALSSSSVAETSTTATNPSVSAGQATPGNNSATGSLPADATPPTAATGVQAAEQESLLNEMPVYRTNARDVIVDVVVTKGSGDPVQGLTKQDFEVKEDGKPQAIDFLEEHTATASASEEPRSLPTLPQGTYTNAPLAHVGDAVNVLLLDTLNTPQQDQAYVHNEIVEFLKKMQPGTRIAIFALGSKLRYVQGFTTDTAVLLAALNDKEKGAAPVKRSPDRGDVADNAADLERLTMMQSFGVGYLRDALADQSSFDLGTRVSMTFEALDHLALYLEGIPGRKNLIWFSSSFPVVLFPSVAQRASFENSPKMRGYLSQVKKTANMFTVSQISIYPIGAQGMMVEHVGEADSAAPGASEVNGHFGDVADGATSNGTMSPLMGGAADRANTMAAMQQLASSTGGKAYFNTNDLNGALKRAINDGAHYYTLSYSPTNTKMDGTYRDIEIHLKKGHYTLAYRHGYNADAGSQAEAETGTDPMAPVMKLGLPGATGILYGVHVAPRTHQPSADAARAGQNEKLSGTTIRYRVDFFIRLADVALKTDSKGEHDGKLEVGLMAYDRDGKPVNWDRVTLGMNLRPAEFEAMQKSGIPVHMQLDLPDENVNLVTGVYDWSSGKTGSLEIPIEPGQGRVASTLR